jgi:hypothetical protein
VSNEVAERLLDQLLQHRIRGYDLDVQEEALDDIRKTLAAERRATREATVERIRAAVREIEDQYAAAPVFLAILDEEAARE